MSDDVMVLGECVTCHGDTRDKDDVCRTWCGECYMCAISRVDKMGPMDVQRQTFGTSGQFSALDRLIRRALGMRPDTSP